MAIHFTTLVLALLGSLQACNAMKWSQCSEGPFTPDSVTLTPDPPKTGQRISFDILGTYDPDGALLAVLGRNAWYGVYATFRLDPERQSRHGFKA